VSKCIKLTIHMGACDRCRTAVEPSEMCATGKRYLTPQICKDIAATGSLLPLSSRKIREDILRADRVAGVIK